MINPDELIAKIAYYENHTELDCEETFCIIKKDMKEWARNTVFCSRCHKTWLAGWKKPTYFICPECLEKESQQLEAAEKAGER